MHKTLSPYAHAALDYAVAAGFALAPQALDLVGLAAVLSYAIAAMHLALTLFTDFPASAARVIPFDLHGRVELAIGLALPVLAVTFLDDTALAFFVGMSATMLAAWVATPYVPAAS